MVWQQNNIRATERRKVEKNTIDGGTFILYCANMVLSCM